MSAEFWLEALRWIWIPPLTCLIGWMTNLLAVRMLFRPRNPIGIGTLRIQGLIPGRKEDLAKRIGEIVERELLSHQVIRQELHRIDLEVYIDRFVKRFVRRRLSPKLRRIPMIGTLLDKGTMNTVEYLARDTLRDEVEAMRDKIAADIETHLPVRALVTERIQGFDLDKLEQLAYRVAAREFKMIERLGALIGFAVGVMQVLLMAALRL